MSYDIKYKVYDDFKEFAQNELRGMNRKLSVCGFDDMSEATDTHLRLRLLNITRADESLFRKIREYARDAKLTTDEDISTGNIGYVAYIPWNVSRKKTRQTSKPGAPSTVKLMMWTMVLMGTITVAAFTTTWDQWVVLYPA